MKRTQSPASVIVAHVKAPSDLVFGLPVLEIDMATDGSEESPAFGGEGMVQ